MMRGRERRGRRGKLMKTLRSVLIAFDFMVNDYNYINSPSYI